MTMTLTNDEIEKAAVATHQAWVVFCLSHGEQATPWYQAPDWQKESSRQMVRDVAAGKGWSPSASHDAWSASKRASGWSYGEVKDAKAKTHPDLIPFESLSLSAKLKDSLQMVVICGHLGLPIPPSAFGS